MGCGCGKARGGPIPQVQHEGPPAPTVARVAVYEVFDKSGGDVVLSTTNPVAARQEAKRLGASVRVTSRAVESAELQAVAG